MTQSIVNFAFFENSAFFFVFLGGVFLSSGVPQLRFRSIPKNCPWVQFFGTPLALFHPGAGFAVGKGQGGGCAYIFGR